MHFLMEYLKRSSLGETCTRSLTLVTMGLHLSRQI